MWSGISGEAPGCDGRSGSRSSRRNVSVVCVKSIPLSILHQTRTMRAGAASYTASLAVIGHTLDPLAANPDIPIEICLAAVGRRATSVG
jgi:hypothetical protein